VNWRSWVIWILAVRFFWDTLYNVQSQIQESNIICQQLLLLSYFFLLSERTNALRRESRYSVVLDRKHCHMVLFLLLAYAVTCCRNSASPRTRQSAVCSFFSPPSNFVRGHDSTMWDIVWVTPRTHRSLSVRPKACSRRHSVLGLFWSGLEYTTVSLADRILQDG